jgi:hypothetical protein
MMTLTNSGTVVTMKDWGRRLSALKTLELPDTSDSVCQFNSLQLRFLEHD